MSGGGELLHQFGPQNCARFRSGHRGGNAQADVRQYYDGLGRLTREAQAIKAGTARTIDSLYDKASTRTKLTYPGSKEVVFTYDALARVSTIADGANERAVYKYIGSSRLGQKVLKNGANTVSTLKVGYDGLGRITSWLYRNAADDATIVGFGHDYDKVGNPKYEVRVHQASYGDEYSYDKLYRLTRDVYDDSTPTTPTGDPAASAKDDFLYDLVGNRTSAYLKSDTATTYLHDPVNELTKVDNAVYEYDAAGNLTKDGTYSYFWDYENRLTRVKLVSDGSDVAEYTYDALGRRVEKVDHTGQSAVTTRWYLDRWSAVEERDVDDALQATFVNGARLDEYILMNRNSTNYWYMESPIIGNVAALANFSGAVQEGYTYRGYGQATVHTGAGNDGVWFTSDDATAASSALGNPYLFTGRDWDATISLQYNRARWYAPGPGRWLWRDPIYRESMNLYEYVRSRPQRLSDPFGLRSHRWATGEYRFHILESVAERSIKGSLYAWDLFRQGLNGYPIDQEMEYELYYVAGCRGLGAVFYLAGKPPWSNAIGEIDNWAYPIPFVGDYLGMSVRENLVVRISDIQAMECPDGWRGTKVRGQITAKWDEGTTYNLLGYSFPESPRTQEAWGPDGSIGPSTVVHTIIVDCCCPPLLSP